MWDNDGKMKAAWWQDGLHIRPSTPEQRKALAGIYQTLNTLDLVDKTIRSESGAVDGDDENSVV